MQGNIFIAFFYLLVVRIWVRRKHPICIHPDSILQTVHVFEVAGGSEEVYSLLGSDDAFVGRYLPAHFVNCSTKETKYVTLQ